MLQQSQNTSNNTYSFELKQKIIDASNNNSSKELQTSYTNSIRRVELCFRNQRKHFENALWMLFKNICFWDLKLHLSLYVIMFVSLYNLCLDFFICICERKFYYSLLFATESIYHFVQIRNNIIILLEKLNRRGCKYKWNLAVGYSIKLNQPLTLIRLFRNKI